MKKIICFKPFTNIEVHTGGNVTFCCYIQKMLGNLHNEDIFTIFNSQTAQLIRKTFYDGSYSYCDKKRCELFLKDKKMPLMHEYLTDKIKSDIESQKTCLKIAPQVIIKSSHGVCNLKCRFCPEFTRFSRNKFLSEGYIAIFDSIKNLKQVTLAGGEPLYAKNIHYFLPLTKRPQKCQDRMRTSVVLSLIHI